MRACACYGILARLQRAFVERLLGWADLGDRRPDRVGVSEVCPGCGKVWDLELRFNERATKARRLALGVR